MTVGGKLSQGAVQSQDAWTRLMDSWMQTAHDLVGSAAADPFGVLHPDVVIKELFDLTRRAVEINLGLMSSLTGVSVTTGYAVVRGGLTATDAVSTEIVAPIEKPLSIEPPKPEPVRSEQKTTTPIPARTYSRVSKADLEKALSGRNLPKSGTVKELRERLIEADRKAPN